ncbi:amidohydrolase family protein [Streptomyces sp. SID3343]|uniref:N-acyl-D-amino-acid deacylase family protein n=1 Tax=Streptomyces sp. SID3343 TaxID=2690260 RepID=UPI0013688131|nr:amidohydrolase family protein [Streptomyces sp. SID3343]MYW03182.1 amidohydrolase family protein [Streptomyces sp. SID3343]
MQVDLVVREGSLVDGSGSPACDGDLAIDGGRVVAIGDVDGVRGRDEIDARGLVVCPGFVNVLSHAYFTLQADPRGLSDLYQGVTTQVFGEGLSLGPVAGEMTEAMIGLGDFADGARRSWPRLRAFLEYLETRGVGHNVASFVGAENLRMSVAGLDDRRLTDDDLARACALLDRELADGALGVGSALIYPPGSYADTAELTAYAHVLARHDALYISHLRNEGDRLLEGVEELLDIARDSGARAEIFHLKTAGRDNRHKMRDVLSRLEAARAAGIDVTADIYPYAAGGTALASAIPPPFHLGGPERLREHLRDPRSRSRIVDAVRNGGDWEGLWLMSGGADGVVVLSNHPDLGITPGTSVADIAKARGDDDPITTMLDIVLAAPHADAAYFLGDEDNVRLAFERPWVSVGSDSDAPAVDERFADHPVHPRAFGAFARVLGRYARDEGIVSLEEAVRRMTGLPATTLRLRDRGALRVGAHADVAIFSREEIVDTATYANPASYARGMRHVLVNGTPALRDGEPTGALSGRALRRDVS